MPNETIYPVFESVKQGAHLNKEQYQALYKQSLQDPDRFWAKQAEMHLDWFSPWDSVSEVDFNIAEINWFKGGKINVSYNCIDRHLPECSGQTAIVWEGDDPSESEQIIYQQLHDRVC